jgi:hypothetical protein
VCVCVCVCVCVWLCVCGGGGGTNDGQLGTGMFDVGEAVKSYIVDGLRHVVTHESRVRSTLGVELPSADDLKSPPCVTIAHLINVGGVGRTDADRQPITVRSAELRRFANDAMLRDDMLKAWIATTMGALAANRSCFVFHSLWFERMYSGDAASVEHLDRWTRGFSVLMHDTIVIPVNDKHACHWTYVFVRMLEQRIEYYDSMCDIEGETPPGPLKVMSAVREWLHLEAHHSNISLDFSKWQMNSQQCPQQYNGHDCGVFMMFHMLYNALGVKFPFGQRDMPQLRKFVVRNIVGPQSGPWVKLLPRCPSAAYTQAVDKHGIGCHGKPDALDLSKVWLRTQLEAGVQERAGSREAVVTRRVAMETLVATNRGKFTDDGSNQAYGTQLHSTAVDDLVLSMATCVLNHANAVVYEVGCGACSRICHSDSSISP